MAEHIYHATATMAELGLAMAIGTITKIFPQPMIVDSLAKETTKNRIAQTDGKIASFFYGLGCTISNWLGKIIRFLPTFVFLLEIAVLGGMAFSPNVSSVAISLFAVSFLGLIMVMLYVYFNRETFRKTGHHPAVEPVQ